MVLGADKRKRPDALRVSENGVVQVVDTTKPEGAVVSELELGEIILTTPAISDGSIYFRSDARLWKPGKPQT
jgi:outer membrane protein assembly factor BamB